MILTDARKSLQRSMRYKVPPNIVIKTENAAKPEQQGSSYLKCVISELEPVSQSFDYGCGKLRYKEAILKTTDTLTFIDSEVQLSRTQMVCGKLTTVRDATRRSNRLSALNVKEFFASADTWDRGFCINVLSIIPYLRDRKSAIHLIRSKLRHSGTCLFVVQYRNSDFDRMQKMPNARRWQDGFLIDSLRGFSFYALISPDQLETMVREGGFEIIGRVLNEGSVYLYARCKPTLRPRISAPVGDASAFNFSVSWPHAPKRGTRRLVSG